MVDQVNLARRRFIVAAAATGGGLALGFNVLDGAQAFSKDPASPLREMSPWLIIAPDDTVTVRVTTPECGNGAMTQMAMTVAEELSCDWSKVQTEYASTLRDVEQNGVYSRTDPIYTFFSGRSTISERLTLLLQVGASARERLKLAAAQQWGVAVSEVEANNSILTHRASGRTLRYGQIAERAVSVELSAEPALKPQSEWTLLGKKAPGKLHLPSLVNGSAAFGIDIRVPDMLYAALMQSPVQGGRLKSYDFERIRDMPGVVAVVVVDPDEPRPMHLIKAYPDGLDDAQAGIAVIADHYWQARTALAALPVQWEDGEGAKWRSNEQVLDAAETLLEQPGKIVSQIGNPLEVMARQPKIVEATYSTPYCDHAAMEPLNGTARVTADRVDVWHPAQDSAVAHFVAAEEAELPLEKVHFHQTLIGGGFGRRVFANDVRMVVAVARKCPGRAIHVIWSREETTRQGRYRPLTAVRLKAGLDSAGMPQALIGRAAGRGMRPRGVSEEIEAGYSVAFGLLSSAHASGMIANAQVEYHDLPLHLIAGPYRGPGYNANTLFIETFVDECADAAGIDPLRYRLQLYSNWPDPGPLLCLKEAADKAGWGGRRPPGQAQGIAIGNWGMYGRPEAGTTVCAVATVDVSKQGLLKVQALDIAFDCGRILNRDAVLTEIVGGAVFGMNMTLNESLTIKDGRIVEGNFDQYPMLRMADMPKINVHFGGLSGHNRFAEIGEPPVGVIGPAIGNAIFRVTGRRLRSTPFRKHDLSWS